ncbi:hypothetical protein SAMD00019534_065420 [Acytostelium subglobosum LB1]|uniref:hypothetical protein n=1 Tax=Acytostelium subglobosum LB1 TaxID=1410327 RepID=UPI000644AABD|nr:hypothetical protein SAMD00019534_065420 [Acytostelium subglobosum LB1]GAM23367.1 hypothetical protein SAMD00019534_065420 [Acytostelium subglobosum LB1]|eukprot:XP_012753816.1 hypothetical protein SAMD00019534_065420 [Acytostelium subglobosum LB1]
MNDIVQQQQQQQQDTKDNERLVVFILGTTGVGKSKLAIELAKKYNGEIISSDSMQLYKGADVITNKVTNEEMEGITHHMMDILEINQMDYNVGAFIATVIPIIDDILARGRLPIIVGGTHYYTTSILWSNTLISFDEDTSQNVQSMAFATSPTSTPSNTSTTSTTTTTTTTTTMATSPTPLPVQDRIYTYDKLKEVDELMAKKLHKNDARKIKRSLDIYYDTGKRHSDMVLEQKKTQRYRSCLIWLDCSGDALEQRLNDRVDTMLTRGMVREIFDVFQRDDIINQNSTENFTKGITQAIGVKELYPYYQLRVKRTDGDEADNQMERAELDKGVQQIKIRTRQYAIKQRKWVKKLTDYDQLVLHRLDTTDLASWKTSVSDVAHDIVQTYLDNKESERYNRQHQLGDGDSGDGNGNNNNKKQKTKSSSSLDKWEKHYCEVCDNKELNGALQWRNHLKSKVHNNKVAKLERQRERERKSQLEATQTQGVNDVPINDDNNADVIVNDDNNNSSSSSSSSAAADVVGPS